MLRIKKGKERENILSKAKIANASVKYNTQYTRKSDHTNSN